MTNEHIDSAVGALSGLRGKLIAFEGIDGAGKSTTSSTVAEAIRAAGEDCLLINKRSVIVPDNPDLEGHVRRFNELIYQRSGPVAAAVGERHWLYALAAWYHLVEETMIAPALARGANVVLDSAYNKTVARYVVSGTFPESFAREAFSYLRAPDMTFFLELSPEAALKRKGDFSSVETGRTGSSSNHFLAFQSGVTRVLRELAEEKSWVCIDVGPLERHEVTEAVLSQLEPLAVGQCPCVSVPGEAVTCDDEATCCRGTPTNARTLGCGGAPC